MKQKSIDPYQVFFPLGILSACVGVAVWPLYLAGFIQYPGASHSLWMIGNFLLSFACGFLLTAVPKFTGTDPCNRGELTTIAILLCGCWFFFWLMPLTFIVLLGVLGRRFLRRAYSPPPHFVFVGMGLFCGFAGSLGIFLSSQGVALPLQPFRILFLQGLMLCLVLGVGARLLRVLLGYERSPLLRISANIREPDADTWFRAEGAPSVIASFIFLSTGFILEFFPGLEILGRCLRALVVGWVAFSAWKLHRLPRGKGVLAWGIWVSGWSLLVGSVVYPFSGSYAVSALHLVFIGGFGVTALLVASRVILAHGGFKVELERRSHALAWTAALIIFAALARAGAEFPGAGYLRHLGYASAAWLAGVVIWASWMGRRLWG